MTNTAQRFRRTLRSIRRGNLTFLGVGIISAFVLGAILAPWLTPYGYGEMNYGASHSAPSMAHPLGTDFFGRDILSRVLYGIRLSLLLGVIVVTINMVVGTAIGLIAGYFGGWVGNVLMRVTDMFLALPLILFALAIMAVRGPGFDGLVIALTLTGWTGFARLTRAQVLAIREQEFVVAARGLGASAARVVVRHVLTNGISTTFVYASLAITVPILAESALSFLGLGLSPPTPSLGLMLAGERMYMMRAWWSTAFPGVAIMLLVLGFNLVGDGLRDALDPKSVTG